MREIKFRAWDITSQRMIPSLNEMEICEGKIIVGTWNFQETEIVNQHEAILMQYTGLKDKNGKEIYEGDIVLASDEGKYKVCCDVWLCMGIMPLMGMGFVSFTELAGRGNGLDFEIIGNIYENPELLNPHTT